MRPVTEKPSRILTRIFLYAGSLGVAILATIVLVFAIQARGHDLVIFDVNRQQALIGLIAQGPQDDLERIRNAVDLPFRTVLIGNRKDSSQLLAAYTREAGSSSVAVDELPLEGPAGVFSIGHVSLPFPSDDPMYGLNPVTGAVPSYPLGTVALRGESGALVVGLGALSRLRSNPFFDVIRWEVVRTLAADPEPAP